MIPGGAGQLLARAERLARRAVRDAFVAGLALGAGLVWLWFS